MSSWPKWIVGTVALLAALFVCLIYGLYWYGASALPAELPTAQRAYPPEVRQAYWRSESGREPIEIERMDPLKLVWRVFVLTRDEHIPKPTAEERVLTHASRLATIRRTDHISMMRHHLASVASWIRFSNERTPEQIIDLLLEQSAFGRDAFGYDAAAEAYFGLPAQRLTRAEQLALFTVMGNPSINDPDRHPDRFRRHYLRIAERSGVDTSTIDFERDLARLKPASKPAAP
ncbi:transglycosylase domain-containing protein [Lysobacter sp. cf310]|uniref:transglycosylase domain-containing protein n=1 Tax=Lysobacter sp. cf310 TaxID=1761790 RepID=UPI0008EADB87|nr:transglycosylase domain-containing protein [Lysobacter sp. cf310]SFK28159.1 Transglycosylase [Lysobacter sp. cf310]